MAYIKLNEVELVETATESNLLIEENGEIKRVPASNVVTAGGSGGGKVITYTFQSGLYNVDGFKSVTKQEVVDEWNAGSILRFRIGGNYPYNTSNIFNVTYSESSSGITSVNLYYFKNDGTVQSQSV